MEYKTYSHPGQPQMQVQVILASRPEKSKDHKTIYTIRMRYPRPIHGEIMTHRVFGRNARSSRAVPVKTMLNEVRNTPYIPWHWGKNQKGMQAEEECNTDVSIYKDTGASPVSNKEAWLLAANYSADVAEAFMEAGYHKQNPNRLLEPFSWIDTLVTSTDWDNFLWLRDHEHAEPHLQDLARLVKQAIDEAKVYTLYGDAWHIPYINEDDMDYVLNNGLIPAFNISTLLKISAARCARISYKPFDGDSSYEKELARYDQLVSSDRVHASPLEHQATPDNKVGTRYIGGNDNKPKLKKILWSNEHLHGNLDGYIQARKLVPNECHTK